MNRSKVTGLFHLTFFFLVFIPSVQAVEVVLDSETGDVVPVDLAPGVYEARPIAGGWVPFNGDIDYTCRSSVIVSGKESLATFDREGDQPTPEEARESCISRRVAVCPGDTIAFYIDDFPYEDNIGTLKLEVLPLPGVQPKICNPPALNSTVVRDGKQWLQPVRFAGRSRTEIEAFCPGGVCSGTLPGSNIDLTGYTWASRDEITSLFATYIEGQSFGPGPAEIFDFEGASTWAPAFFSDFRCGTCEQSFVFVYGFTRDAPVDGLAPQPGVQDGDEIPDEFGTGLDLMTTSREFNTDNDPRQPFVGAWFWRPLVAESEPLSLGGATVTCGPDSVPTVSNDLRFASCAAEGGSVRAQADVANAAVKVLNNAPPGGYPEYNEATGQIVDLITITSGFDDTGNASGTFKVDVEGLIDDSVLANQSEVNFLAIVWYPGGLTPECIDDADDCGIFAGPFDYAEVWFDLFDGELSADPFSGGGGTAEVLSVSADDLRATLNVPWSVTEDSPSFYVGLFGVAGAPPGAPGLADFFNTAKASFTGPPGFTYSGKNGFASTGVSAEQPSDPVRLSGNIENIDGRDITALVLASGRFLFSNEPVGRYDLGELPRESDGGVRRQIYASGFVPRVEVLRGSTAEPVVLESAGQCPNYNPSSAPAARPESAGQRHTVSGQVFVQDGSDPIRAMVLINGQFDFADAQGNYQVEFPLDGQGQFTRQVYASGFAPSIEKYDASTNSLDIRLARANECQ